MSDESSNIKSGIGVHLLFAFIGIAVITLGIVLLVQSEEFKKNAVQTEATIIEIETYRDSSDETQHRVFVRFFAGDEVIEGNLGYYDGTMREGNTITVYYDPDDPYNFKNTASGILTFVVCFAVGVPFAFIGIVPLLKKNKKQEN